MTYEAINTNIINDSSAEALRPLLRAGWGWRTLGVCAGLGGGVGAALLGSLLTAGSWVSGTGRFGHTVHLLGTILLVATIPLLVLGAHCLDLAEERKARESQQGTHESF